MHKVENKLQHEKTCMDENILTLLKVISTLCDVYCSFYLDKVIYFFIPLRIKFYTCIDFVDVIFLI